MSERRIPGGVKDANGIFIRRQVEETPAKAVESLPPMVDPELSLDDILKRQMMILDRATRHLAMRAATGAMSKDEIQSLATCIKVTMELKLKENELLDTLDDEALREVAGDS